MSDFELEQCYNLLGLRPGASLDEIQQTYLQLVARKRRQGNKEELEKLKEAYTELTEYLQLKAYNQAQEEPKERISQIINEKLHSKHLKAQIKILGSQLRLSFDGEKIPQSRIPVTMIQEIIADLDLNNIEIVKVYGMRGEHNIVWKYDIPLVKVPLKQLESERLVKQAEKNTNTFAYPIAVIIALAVNFTGLTWLWSIWVHEFGHATLAWFAGYRALPTLALTIMTTERSLFVYLGILFLLGLMFWSGRKEGKKWAMGLAVGLALLQFYLTWILPRDTYEMLQGFAGIGGEFYLSTFLMVCFYCRLPERLYWDFWRYIALIIASSTFLDTWWKWNSISKGKESIPWGTFWGGQGDGGGDMDTLVIYGWTDQQIIDTYRTLGNVCLFILIGVYVYFLLKSNPQIKTYILKLIGSK